jgi:hypothetical protein
MYIIHVLCTDKFGRLELEFNNKDSREYNVHYIKTNNDKHKSIIKDKPESHLRVKDVGNAHQKGYPSYHAIGSDLDRYMTPITRVNI